MLPKVYTCDGLHCINNYRNILDIICCSTDLILFFGSSTFNFHLVFLKHTNKIIQNWEIERYGWPQMKVTIELLPIFFSYRSTYLIPIFVVLLFPGSISKVQADLLAVYKWHDTVAYSKRLLQSAYESTFWRKITMQ